MSTETIYWAPPFLDPPAKRAAAFVRHHARLLLFAPDEPAAAVQRELLSYWLRQYRRAVEMERAA